MLSSVLKRNSALSHRVMAAKGGLHGKTTNFRPRPKMYQLVYLPIKEVIAMTPSSEQSRSCCSMEKKRLVQELRKCDLCAESYDEFHQCYRDAARDSGQRSRSCIVS